MPSTQACFHQVRFWLSLLVAVFFGLFYPQPTFAYYTNMPASVVIGQPDFTSKTSNQGGATAAANSLSSPEHAIICNGKLIISDSSNSRVLVYNSIPTTNNAPADVVIGQTNFTNRSANQGLSTPTAKTLASPNALLCADNKLLVADRSNSRVLIYNSVPTANNTAADYVIGQVDFSGKLRNQGGACKANTLDFINNTSGLAYDGQRLYFGDLYNNRILIYNSIPTANNTPADLVLGQDSLTSCLINKYNTASENAGTLYWPNAIYSDGNRLFVADQINYRVLIWNSRPTYTGQPADVVLGQPQFTTSGNFSASATSMIYPRGIYASNHRLFISDSYNNRITIYNSIPTTNGAPADLVLGQANLQTYTNPSTATSSNIVTPSGLFEYQDQLFVAVRGQHRVLIFNNQTITPTLALNAAPQDQAGNLIRFTGRATVTSPYTVASVEYALNGASYSQAAATDGSFDTNQEDYQLEFDPNSNSVTDTSGQKLEGYTLRIRSTNSNGDTKDHFFYFAPFTLLQPEADSRITTKQPDFEFSVNRQQDQIKDNLSFYQIQIRPITNNSPGDWQVHIDNIPVNFHQAKDRSENLQHDHYSSEDITDGVFETNDFYATYTDLSSHIKVHSKTSSLEGTYDWRAIAVTVSGQNLEAGSRRFTTNSSPDTFFSTDPDFPLAVINITGLGDPKINSYSLEHLKSSYTTWSTNPTFFGISWDQSQVTLKLTLSDCQDPSSNPDCIKNYTTTTGPDSRFGINIPTNDLIWGKTYQVNLAVSLNEKYTQLPQFDLHIGRSFPF